MPNRFESDMTRICGNTQCRKEKPVSEFGKNKRGPGGIDYRCKECRRSAIKTYTESHKQERRAYNREYKQKNKEVISLYNRTYLSEYYKQNREKIIADTSRNTTERRRNNIQAKLANNLRRRLSHALKGGSKSKRTLELLGCTMEKLLTYLESKFVAGMSWSNYGSEWHIDHIKPLTRFNLEDEKEQSKACHYSNLQPLFCLDNLRKSDRWEESEAEIKNSA